MFLRRRRLVVLLLEISRMEGLIGKTKGDSSLLFGVGSSMGGKDSRFWRGG